jgi:hypothetical protein
MKHIELTKTTKIASLVTVAGLLVANIVSPEAVLAVPIVILFSMMFLYPGCEKVGIRGMAGYLQAAFTVTLISLIAIILMMLTAHTAK